MKYLFFIIGIFLSALAQANMAAHVEPDTVKLGETFHLIIRDDANPKVQSIPNLTALQEDFTILGTERSVNYSNINGQTSMVSQWIVMMRAKKTGTLIIPPLPVGLQNTKALSISVTGDKTKISQDENLALEKDIRLSTEVDNESPLINQQVIYTVKIYNSRRLLDTHYQPPEVENALLIPLGDSQSYQHEEQGKTYMVDEQHYAIFPQKSGKLTIKPPVFTALTYDVTPTQITTQNKALQLSVQPAPANLPHNSWLPAKSFILKENYENTEKKLSQGSTLVRTVSIEAVGIPGQFMQALPALHFEDKSQFSVYPEPAQEKSLVRGNDIVGKVELKVTYLLNKAGKISIPELSIPWFNTTTGKQEIARLPPRSLEIKALDGNPAVAGTALADRTASIKVIKEARQTWPWLLVGLFALAWFITLGLWLQQKKGWGSEKRYYQKSLQNLQKSCMNGDPKMARDALLAWAKLHWPDLGILNIRDLMPLVHDIQLKKQLHNLSRVLYSKEDNISWSGQALWQAITSLLAKKTSAKRPESPLPPMNLLGK